MTDGNGKGWPGKCPHAFRDVNGLGLRIARQRYEAHRRHLDEEFGWSRRQAKAVAAVPVGVNVTSGRHRLPTVRDCGHDSRTGNRFA